MENLLLQNIVNIVHESAKFMDTRSFDVEQKNGYSNIVTSSDIAVQNFLCEKLSSLLPGSGFMCEEKDLWDSTKEFSWIIDPIDGTTNYSRGFDQCAICVGLKHFNDITHGVVYLPATVEMYTAEKGKGAYCNGKRIHVSGRDFQDSIMCTALSNYHKEYAEICSDIIKETFMQCNDIRRFGACAPELCYLAAGRCELYFEYQLSMWDYAAASLIVQEAGGVIANLDGQALTFDKHYGILAANNQDNMDRLVAIVNKYRH